MLFFNDNDQIRSVSRRQSHAPQFHNFTFMWQTWRLDMSSHVVCMLQRKRLCRYWDALNDEKEANKKSADNNVRLVQRDDKLHSLLARRLDEAKCCGSKRMRENLSPVTGSRQWSCCCCAPSSRVVRDQIEFHFDIRSASRIIRNREWASRKRVENRSWKKLQDCRDVCYWMEFFMLRFPPSSANSSSIGISDDALSPPFLMLFFNQV